MSELHTKLFRDPTGMERKAGPSHCCKTVGTFPYGRLRLVRGQYGGRESGFKMKIIKSFRKDTLVQVSTGKVDLFLWKKQAIRSNSLKLVATL